MACLSARSLPLLALSLAQTSLYPRLHPQPHLLLSRPDAAAPDAHGASTAAAAEGLRTATLLNPDPEPNPHHGARPGTRCGARSGRRRMVSNA